MFAVEKIGRLTFNNYVKAFGFGQLTGITLETEVPGNISSLDKAGDIYYLTASFGQGITATPIQLISAYSAIANGGLRLKPYIVSEIIKPDGTEVKINVRSEEQAVKKRTAALVTGMLVSVVDKGYDKKAKVDGYYLAGKTGTAQIAGPNGGYGSDINHTFVGFGPVSNPRFSIFLKLESPQGIKFASDTLGPLFRQISQFLLEYYQVPPDY